MLHMSGIYRSLCFVPKKWMVSQNVWCISNLIFKQLVEIRKFHLVLLYGHTYADMLDLHLGHERLEARGVDVDVGKSVTLWQRDHDLVGLGYE
jgi:hypothetical protein